jgi:hypothetical protein
MHSRTPVIDCMRIGRDPAGGAHTRSADCSSTYSRSPNGSSAQTSTHGRDATGAYHATGTDRRDATGAHYAARAYTRHWSHADPIFARRDLGHD